MARSHSIPIVYLSSQESDHLEQYTGSGGSYGEWDTDSDTGRGRDKSPSRFSLGRKMSRFLRRSFRRKSSGSTSSHFLDVNNSLDDRDGSKRNSFSSTDSSVFLSLEFDLEENEIHVPVRRARRDLNNADMNEHLYRELVRCLLYPLGSPDQTVGLRPGDLLDYISTVFKVDLEDHELLLRDELVSEPRPLQVSIAVLDALDIKMGEKKGSPNLNSSRLSPRGSTNSDNGPGSPKLHRTQTCTGSQSPTWNEEFLIDLEELLTDEVHIYICDQELAAESSLQHNDRPRLKSLFRQLRHSVEHESLSLLGCFGKIVIPVRDIPVLGTDGPYNIISLGSSWSKPKVVGKCHLRMSISYRKDVADETYFSTDDYYKAFRQFVLHNFKSTNVSETSAQEGAVLSDRDQRILQMFAGANGISKLSQAIAQVNCMLDILEEDDSYDLGTVTLNRAITALKTTWSTMPGGKRKQEKMPLTDAEISEYRKRAGKYIHKAMDTVGSLPSLFPIKPDTIDILKDTLGACIQLLKLDLWEVKCPLLKELSNKLLKKIQDDVRAWLRKQCEEVMTHVVVVRETVVQEISRFTKMVTTLTTHCALLPTAKAFFNEFYIKYYRVISIAIEKVVTQLGSTLMQEMDSYLKRSGGYMGVMTASRLTLRLYGTVRTLLNKIREHVTRRDIMRFGISKYQDWFTNSLPFWLQALRTEAINRMDRALEIDKDVVLVSNLVQYSHSSVDVLSSFAKIKDEWCHIDIRVPDWLLMGVTSVTDIICDGARLYAEKVHLLLKKNRFFQNKQSREFEITEKLCIMLNNIDHVRLYLSELPKLLDWDTASLIISTQYSDDEVGDQAERTLNRLVDTVDLEIKAKRCMLLHQVATMVAVELDRYMLFFTQKCWDKPSSVDPLLVYLTGNLNTLHAKLTPGMLTVLLDHLWNMVIASFCRQLKTRECVEYYVLMQKHLHTLASYFNTKGQESTPDSSCTNTEYRTVKAKLEQYSISTPNLMQEYFKGISENVTTPTEPIGQLAFKAAYVEETKGKVTIFINVLRGMDLPGLDPNGLSDPYVVVNLQPEKVLEQQPQQTSVIRGNLNPVFNTVFTFPNVPSKYLKENGACLQLIVLDYDSIGSDDFAGEVLIQLSGLSKIGFGESIDSQPVVIMPLKRPQLPSEGPYQVLLDRPWDKAAKSFTTERNKLFHNQAPRTDGMTGINIFFNVFNKFVP